jgi:hypothetical protein
MVTLQHPKQERMMRLGDPAGEPPLGEVPVPVVAEVPLPAPAEQPIATGPSRRTHLVVVITRKLGESDGAEPIATIRARYWNPHDRRWNEDDFESMEHLRRRHVDESGWVLLQEQALDAALAVELIFQAHRIDFTRPSREQILRDIGMTPDDVNELLDHVDRDQERE